MSEMEESIKRGLEQSARGETYDLGDFTQYVGAATREDLIDIIVGRTGSTAMATDIADDVISAGWLSTEEHMRIIADAAYHGGQINRSLQDRLNEAEAALALWKAEALENRYKDQD